MRHVLDIIILLKTSPLSFIKLFHTKKLKTLNKTIPK